ncbi:MAG: fructose-6-phosphate aldolase [Bradymonadales bacterium]|nr:MAG: fructose-6-phosphate aldolase [Bradymonadales bacterium]
MKLFLDTANIQELKDAAQTGLIDGVTTNPSLVAKEGVKFEDRLREICEFISGPVSAEVISLDYEGMMREAKKLVTIAKNIVIKVPLTREGLRACKSLRADGVDVNVTLCFSPLQALLAAKAGATFVSPFVGRLDDIGQAGMSLIEDILQIFRMQQLETQVLVASVRHTEHLLQAAMMGADVATIPYKVFNQAYQHPLTDIGIEKFLADWKSSKTRQESSTS